MSSFSYIYLNLQYRKRNTTTPSSKPYRFCIMLYSFVSGYFNFQHLWHLYILKGKMWRQFKSLITEAVVISRRSTEARVAWRGGDTCAAVSVCYNVCNVSDVMSGCWTKWSRHQHSTPEVISCSRWSCHVEYLICCSDLVEERRTVHCFALIMPEKRKGKG